MFKHDSATLSAFINAGAFALRDTLNGNTVSPSAIADAAVKRAIATETANKASMRACWRIALGGKEEGDAGELGGFRPSRLAYRFIKSVSGWARTQVGADSLNEALPSRGQQCETDDVADESNLHPDDYSKALAAQSAPLPRSSHGGGGGR